MSAKGSWVVITPDNAVEEIEARSGIQMPEVMGSGGPYAVCNHLVTSGIWMWYREYERDVEPSLYDTVNYCATALWSIRDLSAPKKIVYGPVIFTGGIHRTPLASNHVAGLFVLANFARVKSEEYESALAL